MGKFSRAKGLRNERELVNLLRDRGIDAERVPLSGAAHGSFAGDVIAPIHGQQKRIECKVRATGFKTLYDWLSDADILAVKRDRDEWLVVMTLEDYLNTKGTP